MVDFERELEAIAHDIHQQLHSTIGWNVCLVSGEYQAIIVLDRFYNVVFTWSA